MRCQLARIVAKKCFMPMSALVHSFSFWRFWFRKFIVQRWRQNKSYNQQLADRLWNIISGKMVRTIVASLRKCVTVIEHYWYDTCNWFLNGYSTGRPYAVKLISIPYFSKPLERKNIRFCLGYQKIVPAGFWVRKMRLPSNKLYNWSNISLTFSNSINYSFFLDIRRHAKNAYKNK